MGKGIKEFKHAMKEESPSEASLKHTNK